MKPGDLQAASFAAYPQSSRELAGEYLAILRTMPLSLLPSYLVQVQQYPTLFPIEAERLRGQLAALQARPELMQAFAGIELPPELEHMDWVRQPAIFTSALSGALWQTRQIDTYHRAAEALFAELPQPRHVSGSTAPMLIAAMGRGAARGRYALFTRLRKQGLYVRKLDETGAAATLTNLLAKRAQTDASAYTHWYVDGGEPWFLTSKTAIEQISFPALSPVTATVLREMDHAVREGSGPEALADRLGAMQPAALGLDRVTTDPRMARFFLTLLTQGSGTQLYSTSFVQAAAVELVRRAQPQTLLLRFAPRRKPASMNDMLEQRAQSVELDADGALVDADIAVYYAWLAMQRQPDGARATLLVYVEGHGEAFVAGPGVTRSAESTTSLRMEQLLALSS